MRTGEMSRVSQDPARPTLVGLLQLTQTLKIAGHCDDLRPFLRERQGDRAPEPSRSTRHEPATLIESEFHAAIHPPSTNKLWPVIKLASSLARNSAAEAISAGRPRRGHGVRECAKASDVGSRSSGAFPVITFPGATAL